MRGRTLGYVALGLFVASWFLPVHQALLGSDDSAFGANRTLGFEEGTPPGWRACRVAWDMLLEGKENWREPVLGLTCFTNLVMVLAALMLLIGASAHVLGLVLVFCAIHNAGWIYLNLGDTRFVESLQVGYYAWTISFVLAGRAFLRGIDE